MLRLLCRPLCLFSITTGHYKKKQTHNRWLLTQGTNNKCWRGHSVGHTTQVQQRHHKNKSRCVQCMSCVTLPSGQQGKRKTAVQRTTSSCCSFFLFFPPPVFQACWFFSQPVAGTTQHNTTRHGLSLKAKRNWNDGAKLLRWAAALTGGSAPGQIGPAFEEVRNGPRKTTVAAPS